MRRWRCEERSTSISGPYYRCDCLHSGLYERWGIGVLCGSQNSRCGDPKSGNHRGSGQTASTRIDSPPPRHSMEGCRRDARSTYSSLFWCESKTGLGRCRQSPGSIASSGVAGVQAPSLRQHQPFSSQSQERAGGPPVCRRIPWRRPTLQSHKPQAGNARWQRCLRIAPACPAGAFGLGGSLQ